MTRGLPLSIILVLACGRTASGQVLSHQSLIPVSDWWPVRVSEHLALPDGRTATVHLVSDTTHPCYGGRVLVDFVAGSDTVYRDTLSMGRWQGCWGDDLAALKAAVADLRRLEVRRVWDLPKPPTPDQATDPFILVYLNQYESVRGIAWNSRTHRFDVVMPGGMW
jgi:hypothetical protein